MSSDYCSRSDIEATYGTTNVAEWADMDGDEDAAAILTRINRAIEIASEDIDDLIRGSSLSYGIPIADKDGNTPTTIEELCAVKAGIWLYHALGQYDQNRQTGTRISRLLWRERWADKVLDEILQGKRHLLNVKR